MGKNRLCRYLSWAITDCVATRLQCCFPLVQFFLPQLEALDVGKIIFTRFLWTYQVYIAFAYLPILFSPSIFPSFCRGWGGGGGLILLPNSNWTCLSHKWSFFLPFSFVLTSLKFMVMPSVVCRTICSPAMMIKWSDELGSCSDSHSSFLMRFCINAFILSFRNTL